MTSAYVGTTAPSSTTNPPLRMTGGIGGQGNRSLPGNSLWYYCSSNSTTEVTTANFFTDGYYLGMKAGDIVMGVYQTSVGSTAPIPYMGCITESSTDGATLHTATT